MECVCLECGEKVNSKELWFDFTQFLKKFFVNMTKKAGINIAAECERLFNDWEKSAPFQENEEELWNLKRVEGFQSVRDRQVIYKIPVDKVKERMGNLANGTENIFRKWIEDNSDEVRSRQVILILRKVVEGDIRISKVLDKEGETVAGVRHCPKCKAVMSHLAGCAPEICLTVLGGPRVSKSTTVTACLCAFLEGDALVKIEGHQDDAAWQDFIKDYLDNYKKGIRVKETETQKDKIPRITCKVSMGGRSFNLSFADLPGEYNNNEGLDPEVLKRFRFYSNMDFVWYCTDPGEVKQLQGNADSSEAIKNLGYEKNQGIVTTNKLKSNMENLSGYFMYEKKKIPVIYILGKTDDDVITPEEKEDFALYRSEEQEDYYPFDVKKFYDLSNKVRNYIAKYNPDQVKAFEDNFADRCYIAVSAYGCIPPENGIAEKFPYHRKLPLLWMLALRNCIEVKLTVAQKGVWKRHTEEITASLAQLPDDIRKKVLHNLYMHGPYRI